MDFETNPVLRWITNIREWGLENASRRYYTLYPGVVASNTDLSQQGNVKVKVAVLGSGERTTTGGFIPNTISNEALPGTLYAGNDHGMYFPPEVDDLVWVSFDHGDPTVPRYHGSYWRNVDPALSAAGSHLPAEFRSADGIPKVRGIKTAFGHGLTFDDTPIAPNVRLWSGKNTALGQPAAQKQLLVLTDDPSDAGIGLFTFYGHYVDMNDTTKKFTISGRPKDPTGTIANSIEIDDTQNKITIKTQNPAQSIVIDATQMSITVTNPGLTTVNSVGPVSVTSAATVGITAAAAATIFATGGIAMGSGAAPPAPPIPGTAVETGAGAKIVNFAGAWTETIGGAFVQTVVGALSMSAAAMNLSAAVLNLAGNIVVTGTAAFGPGTQQQLMNQQLIDWLVTHTHPTAAPGPPSPPTQGPLLGTTAAPLPPYVTTALTAS